MMRINPHYRWTLIVGAGFALLSVALGAFAAHGLKNSLDAYSVAIFETGAKYQMYHALGLCFCGLLQAQFEKLSTKSNRLLHYAAICFVVGIVLFSGSLYLLALTSVKWLGMVTPLGGISFIAAWLLIIIAVGKS